MVVNPAIRALVRDNKSHQISTIIQTGGSVGMKTMNQAVYELYRSGAVSWDEAMANSTDPNELQRLLQRSGVGTGRYR